MAAHLTVELTFTNNTKFKHVENFSFLCQAFLKMSQKIFKIGPDGFGAYLL